MKPRSVQGADFEERSFLDGARDLFRFRGLSKRHPFSTLPIRYPIPVRFVTAASVGTSPQRNLLALAVMHEAQMSYITALVNAITRLCRALSFLSSFTF